MISRHGLRRPWFLEFEFYAALAAIGWGALAFGTSVDMPQRPTLAELGFLSDNHWALIAGSLGIIELVCVMLNSKFGRWLVAIPLSYFWGLVVLAIVRSVLKGEPIALATALYAATLICMLLKVARLPTDFPARG